MSMQNCVFQFFWQSMVAPYCITSREYSNLQPKVADVRTFPGWYIFVEKMLWRKVNGFYGNTTQNYGTFPRWSYLIPGISFCRNKWWLLKFRRAQQLLRWPITSKRSSEISLLFKMQMIGLRHEASEMDSDNTWTYHKLEHTKCTIWHPLVLPLVTHNGNKLQLYTLGRAHILCIWLR